MGRSSDLSTICDVLGSDERLVFLAPSPERFEQSEVHHDAQEEIRCAGLPRNTPYAGWHGQQHAFDRAGRLERPQHVYFGGDRTLVRRALARLEQHGYAVFGGSDDDEPFLIASDAHPTTAGVAQLEALRTRAALLADSTLARLGPAGMPPLREGEELLLHEVLTASELRPAAADGLQRDAFRALRDRGLLATADLDAVLGHWREVFAASKKDRRDFVETVMNAHHPATDELMLDLIAAEEAETALLLTWGDPRGEDEIKRQALAGPLRDFAAYVRRQESRARTAAAVAVAEQARARDLPERVRWVARHLANWWADDDETSPFLRSLHFIEDEAIPAWLRLEVARTGTARIRDARARAERSGPDWRPRKGVAVSIADRLVMSYDADAAREALARWDGAAYAVHVAAGMPWLGFDIVDRGECKDAIERLTLDPRQVEGLRLHLAASEATEPTLGVALHLLRLNGYLRVQDLHPLRSGWKKQLLVKPDPYALAPPAVLTFLLTLADASDDLATQVAEKIITDNRKWVREQVRLLVTARVSDEPGLAGELAEAAGTDGTSRVGALASVIHGSRTAHMPPRAVAAESYERVAGSPAWRATAFLHAGIALADPDRPLWPPTFDDESERWLGAALDLAEDASLPMAFRQACLRTAQTSYVPKKYPERVRPVAVTHDVAVQWLRRRKRAEAELGF